MTSSAKPERMAAVTLITVAGYLCLGCQAAFDRRFGPKDRQSHGPGRKLPRAHTRT